MIISNNIGEKVSVLEWILARVESIAVSDMRNLDVVAQFKTDAGVVRSAMSMTSARGIRYQSEQNQYTLACLSTWP